MNNLNYRKAISCQASLIKSFKVVFGLNFWDEILKCHHSNLKDVEKYFSVVLTNSKHFASNCSMLAITMDKNVFKCTKILE